MGEPRLAPFELLEPVVAAPVAPELVLDDLVLDDLVVEPGDTPEEVVVEPPAVVAAPPAGVEDEESSPDEPPSATAVFKQVELLLVWIVTCCAKTWLPVLSRNAGVMDVPP